MPQRLRDVFHEMATRQVLLKTGSISVKASEPIYLQAVETYQKVHRAHLVSSLVAGKSREIITYLQSYQNNDFYMEYISVFCVVFLQGYVFKHSLKKHFEKQGNSSENSSIVYPVSARNLLGLSFNVWKLVMS